MTQNGEQYIECGQILSKRCLTSETMVSITPIYRDLSLHISSVAKINEILHKMSPSVGRFNWHVHRYTYASLAIVLDSGQGLLVLLTHEATLNHQGWPQGSQQLDKLENLVDKSLFTTPRTTPQALAWSLTTYSDTGLHRSINHDLSPAGAVQIGGDCLRQSTPQLRQNTAGLQSLPLRMNSTHSTAHTP